MSDPETPEVGPETGELKRAIREKYAAAARRAAAGDAGCRGPSSSCSSDPVTGELYGATDAASVPEGALAASLGCGDPSALAELREGEVVLDLGSGGGIDVLLSARRVGASGRAFGVDMTEEMIELARRNAREAGVENVEFLKGEIEDLPLPAESVDVVISNCVINLSGDKRRTLAEAYRVLRPGGRLAVSDVVVRGPLVPEIRRSLELWTGCIAGAPEEREYLALLGDAGFVDATIEPTRVYGVGEARDALAGAGLDAEELAAKAAGRLASAFVRARKPPG